MQLTPNFTLEEMVMSETAERRGISNVPNATVIPNLVHTAHQMEIVRRFLGNYPIIITSGYRSRELNAVVGGVKDSAHINGDAVDFICPHFGTPYEIAEAICTELPRIAMAVTQPSLAAFDPKVQAMETTEVHRFKWDQLIYEFTWVHISFALGSRGELFTRNAKVGFKPGITRLA